MLDESTPGPTDLHDLVWAWLFPQGHVLVTHVQLYCSRGLLKCEYYSLQLSFHSQGNTGLGVAGSHVE